MNRTTTELLIKAIDAQLHNDSIACEMWLEKATAELERENKNNPKDDVVPTLVPTPSKDI